MLRLTRRSAIKARTQAGNQLHAVVATAPAPLRAQLRGLKASRLVSVGLQLALDPVTVGGPQDAARFALASLARRWQGLTEEIAALDAQLDRLVAQAAPAGLLDELGVGTDVAGALLVAAGDNPERLCTEASFAALCGVSPVEASSGKTTRHRLNRGGDRQANYALYILAVTRMAWDPRTRAYVAKRQADGKTTKEVIRCLKRHIAREIYRLLTTPAAAPPRTT